MLSGPSEILKARNSQFGPSFLTSGFILTDRRLNNEAKAPRTCTEAALKIFGGILVSGGVVLGCGGQQGHRFRRRGLGVETWLSPPQALCEVYRKEERKTLNSRKRKSCGGSPHGAEQRQSTRSDESQSGKYNLPEGGQALCPARLQRYPTSPRSLLSSRPGHSGCPAGPSAGPRSCPRPPCLRRPRRKLCTACRGTERRQRR